MFNKIGAANACLGLIQIIIFIPSSLGQSLEGREDTNRVCQNTRSILEVKKKIIFYVCWNDCAGVALRNSRKGINNINPMEFEILDMCRFRILTRIIDRHTPLKPNNKCYLKCAVFFGKQDTSFYPKTSDSDSLSFVGSVFFSCVSACFNFDLSNLVTSSRFGLSAIVGSS